MSLNVNAGIRALPAAQRRKVEARAAQLIGEEMTLRELRKARKLTRLKTKRQIVDKALELLVRSESRKGILRYYGSGVWKGDLRTSRRNRV